jgi:hypothetical protein
MDLYKRYSLDSILTKGAKKTYTGVPQDRVGQVISDITYENKGIAYSITITPANEVFNIVIEYF